MNAKTKKMTNKVELFKDQLQVLALSILNRKECEKAFRKTVKKMGPDHLCAGSTVLNKSPCNVI